MFKKKTLAFLVSGALITMAGTMQATAASTGFDNFTALSSSVAAGSLPESSPFQLANPSWTQVSIANRTNQLNQGQDNSGNWDMITANETGIDAGRYLFMPFETDTAGVQRIDLLNPDYNTRTVTLVAPGTQDFVSGDASLWTPWGSYLTAEESWGTGSTNGRLFELTNPITATGTGDSNFVQRAIIPHVSHEGLAFDNHNNFYFIDEVNGGSIYKYVSANPNATNGDDYFAAGQTFVMQVSGGGNANATGAITWAPITDANGGVLAGISVLNSDGSIDGRLSADNALGTDYQRPEDLQIKTLANGDQILYVATTTTDEVYSFNLGSNTASLFANTSTLDQATGLGVGDTFNNPDNLAIDAEGNIYIVEDQPGGQADIWFATDANNDGIAESIGRWASLSTLDAEPTGLYFDKFNPNVAYVNVQHPLSGDDRTIMLTVPEPGTYAMLLAGLGLIGVSARRRKFPLVK
ncbi:alkaline phosphatase PhoX [Nitrosomonas sp.]|uniref:alkaline phosphatase PhoX n=1 Tax=Nitrosomonas sp. TaxID=42353 RepID=UPI00374CBD74